MTIKLYPVKIEAYCQTMQNHLFTCTAFDDEYAELELKTGISADGWPELSDAIKTALNMMFEEDAKNEPAK